MDIGRRLVVGEGEREADLYGRAIGAAALALEVHGVGGGDTGCAEARFIRARVLRFEDEHRQSLAAFDEVAVIAGEQT